MYNNWENIREDQNDFEEICYKLKLELGDLDYTGILDKMEKEIQKYADMSHEEWENVVKCGLVPEPVLWYEGEIDVSMLFERYLNEEIENVKQHNEDTLML